MPSDPAQVVATAAQYRTLGRTAEAERLLREALGERPDSPELLTELSAVLRAGGDLGGAEAAARAAIAQAPQWTAPLVRLALVVLQQNRTDEAAALAATVIAMDPQTAGAWALLGLAGADKRTPRDRAIARDAVRRAIALDPGESEYRWFAAVVEHAFGDVPAARALVEQGLAMDPQSMRLLALRAEYAPVAAQPALLVDVLTADPGAEEPRQLLDAAVTWERRLALTPATVLPVLVAAVAAVGAPVATLVVALAADAAGVLVLQRYRRRSGVLPAGYLMVRSAAARGTAAMRVLLAVSAAAVLAGALVAFVSAPAAALVLTVGILAGAGAVLAVLPDDQRVLAAARRRSGRVRGGTAWRYGGLRQELTLFSALAVGVVGQLTVAGAVLGPPRPGAGAAAVASALCLALLLVEAFNAGLNAPQRYLRALGVRYRLLIAGAMTLALLTNGLAALAGADLRSRDDPSDPSSGSTIRLPADTGVPSFDVPTIDVPSFPSLTVPPIDTSG